MKQIYFSFYRIKRSSEEVIKEGNPQKEIKDFFVFVTSDKGGTSEISVFFYTKLCCKCEVVTQEVSLFFFLSLSFVFAESMR